MKLITRPWHALLLIGASGTVLAGAAWCWHSAPAERISIRAQQLTDPGALSDFTNPNFRKINYRLYIRNHCTGIVRLVGSSAC